MRVSLTAIVVVFLILLFQPQLSYAGPVFRSISANAAPASKPRVPGQLYQIPAQTSQIRAVNSSKDLVLVTNRVITEQQRTSPRQNEVVPATRTPPMAEMATTDMQREMREAMATQAAPRPAVPSNDEMAAQLADRFYAMRNGKDSAFSNSRAPGARSVRLIVPGATAKAIVRPKKKGALYSLDTYRDLIQTASLTHGVDPALVRAIIHAESSFNLKARSHVGAGGLMQLMPATATRFGVSDRFDPAQNINGGTRYLAWLLKRYNGNVTLATAAYNAGEGAVDKYRGVPPYRETKGYVVKVASLFQSYHLALTGSYSGLIRQPLVASLTARPSMSSYALGVRAISATRHE